MANSHANVPKQAHAMLFLSELMVDCGVAHHAHAIDHRGTTTRRDSGSHDMCSRAHPARVDRPPHPITASNNRK